MGLYQPHENHPQVQKITRQEPVEYGQIIKWRQGEIVGLGSSSVVYQAIRVDTNKTFAVKKFKVVSDITGIDQNKLKIIKVSIITSFISNLFYCFYRTKYKNTNN